MNNLVIKIWLRAVVFLLIAVLTACLFLSPASGMDDICESLGIAISVVIIVFFCSLPALLCFRILLPLFVKAAPDKPDAIVFAIIAAAISCCLLPLLLIGLTGEAACGGIPGFLVMIAAGALPSIVSILTCHNDFNSFHLTSIKSI